MMLIISFLSSFNSEVSAQENKDNSQFIPVSEVGDIYDENKIFYIGSETCSSCQEFEEYVSGLEIEEPFVFIDVRNQENEEIIDKIMERGDVEQLVTPILVKGEESLVGFNSEVKRELNSWLGLEYHDNSLVSSIAVEDRWGLALMTIVIGMVDGVNPCSIWALMFLITIMMGKKFSKKQMTTIGIIYILTISLIYGLFIVGVSFISHNIMSNIFFRVSVFSLASFIGISNILVSLKKKPVVDFSISNNHKKKFLKFARLRLDEKSSFVRMVLASISIGIFASLIELPCTAGFPIIWNSYMAEFSVTGVEYSLFLALYIVLYVIIEFILLISVVFSMRKLLLSEKYGLSLKFSLGMLMIFLGASFLFGDAIIRQTSLLIVMTIISVVGGILRYKFNNKIKK